MSFLNGEHIHIARDFHHLGFVSFHGTPEQMQTATDGIPEVVRAGACGAGADAVSLNAAMAAGNVRVIQFSLWRSLKPPAQKPTSEPNHGI